MSLLLIIIGLVVLFGFGGGYYNGGAYRSYGYGTSGVLVVLLVVLLLTGTVHL